MEGLGNDSAEPAVAAFDRVRIVLCRPSHPGNIGATARAMKTMGLSRLLLVAPERPIDAQAEAMASGATDVLAAACTVASLGEALAGTIHAVALTARRRELAAEPLWARTAAAEAAALTAAGEVALVFGNETFGLTNDELMLCPRWAQIPANPAYGSLNLAAAVQVLCYELRLALCDAGPPPAIPDAGHPASHEEIAGLIAQAEQAAIGCGYLDPARPRRFTPRLWRLAQRARLEREEIHLLRGLLAALRKG